MAIGGSNDYNAQKLTPSEVLVSRTLQAKNRAWHNVIWRTGKPALDSEWNLFNDANFEALSQLIRGTTPSGWLELGQNRYSDNSGTANNIQFWSAFRQAPIDIPNCIVNGWPLTIGGVNYTDTSLNSINLEPASVSATGYRYDFVFLEVFKAQVRSRDENNNQIAQNKPSLNEIYAYGNTQFGGTNFPDDIVDPAIQPSTNGIETSQRVQLQYRIRVVSGIQFLNNLASGFDDTTVQGQGANPNPQATAFPFVNMGGELNDPGLWRSGSGDEASRIALRTVDGYTYAIPMFKIYRRTQIPYDDIGANPTAAFNNQQGNAADLSSGVSDRPDGKFHDGIDASDIIDLRYKCSLNGFDFESILEDNLDLLLKNDLESSILKTLQYDSIADSDVNGYIDFRNNEGASGKRKIWSDAATDQDDIYAEVTTSTTNNSLDVYINKVNASVNWASGDQIIVQITSKLPSGTVVKATPRIFVEEKDPFATDQSTSGVGSWSGLNTDTATFTFSGTLSNNKNLWIFYDIALPVGQGISFVPNQLAQVKYSNYSAFSNATPIRGEILFSNPTRFQDLANHPFENKSGTSVYKEIDDLSQRKQITIQPMVQTTSARDGGTRTLEVATTDATAKIVTVPFPIQHLKGIYTSATGGTELATQTIINATVDGVDDTEDWILIDEDFYIAELTSLKYDPTAAFVGGETELLVVAGGAYNPVYEHQNIASNIGSRVKLYDTSGNIFDIPSGTNANNFRYSGRRIAIRSGSGYGYDLNNFVIDCQSSDNNALFGGFVDGQQLWIDMDYLAAPHEGAQILISYEHTPYQGAQIGGQDLSLVYRRNEGIFFNNGTGGGTISTTDGTGTSNIQYTPISPKLPGSFSDYLRDGVVVDIASKGIKRFDSDAWFWAQYDMYGYYGGSNIWRKDFTMPPTPEATSRGFLGLPFMEVIFELPTVDQTFAEFAFFALVRNKQTSEIYLYVQIGNKGNHKTEAGPVYQDFYRLKEKIILR